MFTLPGTNDWLFTGKVLNISCNESRSIITAVTRKIFDISCNEPEVSEQLLQVTTDNEERRNAKNRENYRTNNKGIGNPITYYYTHWSEFKMCYPWTVQSCNRLWIGGNQDGKWRLQENNMYTAIVWATRINNLQ